METDENTTSAITTAATEKNPPDDHKTDTAVVEIKEEADEDKKDDKLLALDLLSTKPPLVDINPADTKTEIRARALLCPLTGTGRSMPMTLRTLNIGTGANMDVCLETHGHCNFVSPKHASIFYDDLSRQYELLNYSEHGTTVDNVLYSCDFSDKAATTRPATRVIQSVRDIINNIRGKKDEEKEKQFMSAKAQRLTKVCGCQTSSSSLIGGSGAGWEGTAVLHHGSYIKFGCVQFVFSIVQQAKQDPTMGVQQGKISLLRNPLK